MPLERIQILNEKTNQSFRVMFNPEEYNLNKDNNYASQAIPGLQSPLLQFVSGNLRTLDMELFFDSFEAKQDVRGETQKVVTLLDIDSDLHTPPVLRVTWGSLEFRCVLAKVSQKFVKFFTNGQPARAKLNVTFNEYLDAASQVAAANLQTSDFSKIYVVKQGDTMNGVAARFYEDPAKWRPIALSNGILDPLSISAGQQLFIPALPYTDPATGVVMQ
jgi:LysM repeat protein